MGYYDDDDNVGSLEKYLRQVGSPSQVEEQTPLDSTYDPTSYGPQKRVSDEDIQGGSRPVYQNIQAATDSVYNPSGSSAMGASPAPVNAIASETLQNPVTPPPPSPGSDYSKLLADQAKYGAPINPRDPQYKMGIGHRILGVIANAANGYARNGAAPIYVGSGATNRRYDQDEAMRQTNLANTQTQIKSAQEQQEEARKGYQTQVQAQERSAIAQRNEAQAKKFENAIDPNTIRYDEDNDRWVGKTYGGDEQEVNEPKWSLQNKTKQAEDDSTPATGVRPQKQPDGTLAVPSKSGKKMIPYVPKTIEEGVMLGDKTSKNLWYWQHRDKERGSQSNDPNLSGLNANEQRLYHDKTTALDEQMQAIRAGMAEGQKMRGLGVDLDQKAGASQVSDLYKLQKQKDDIADQIRSSRKGARSSGPSAPGGNSGQTHKTITRAQVQKLADDNKLSYDAAESQFKSKGYKIQ